MTLAAERLDAIDPALRRVKLLRLEQVAELLGVDRATVWRWRRKANPLPVTFLPGRGLKRPAVARVKLADLERWIADEDEAARRGGAC
jgi:predicted DNA-binding transcriptional regulator AlpA